MTDLERVRSFISGRTLRTLHSAEDAARDLDAHLKEDAERERRADEFASIIQDKLMAQAAELAKLREAVREVARKLGLAQRELQDPAWDLHTMTFVAAMIRDARQLIEEKP